MKWLEIIHIRTSEKKSERLVEELTKITSKLSEAEDEANVVLFRNSQLPTDFSLHLIHQSGPVRRTKSNIGQVLSAMAREYGLVNHTVWVTEQPKSE